MSDLREMLDRATPVPWRDRNEHYRSIQGSPREGEAYGEMVTTFTGAIASQQGYGRANAALIVAAVNVLPTHLDQLAAKDARIAELEAERDALADHVAVHLNMLRGGIAKPSPTNIWHLYGRALLDAMPAEYRAALASRAEEASPAP